MTSRELPRQVWIGNPHWRFQYRRFKDHHLRSYSPPGITWPTQPDRAQREEAHSLAWSHLASPHRPTLQSRPGKSDTPSPRRSRNSPSRTLPNHQRLATHQANFETPLRVAEAKSVLDEELIPLKLIYPDREGETYSVRARPAHKWHYLNKQTLKEVLLIKCFWL